MTSDHNKADWSNYWQGRTAGEVGDALVGGQGVGIEHSQELAEFWKGALSAFSRDAALIDLACGAGSVLRHAHVLGFEQISGIDISDDAIAAMRASIPGANGIVGPVDQMPIKDNQYDLVVSQFGFEYAGSEAAVLKTAQEIVRILNPEGSFIAICHIQDGGIDQEVSSHLKSISELEATGFISASKDFFAALFTAEANPNEQNQLAFQKASQALNDSRQYLNDWLNTGMAADNQIKQLGQHLLSGASDLFSRRQAYALEDITGWLDGMQNEIDAYKGRMSSMKRAALNAEACASILGVFAQASLATSPATPLHFGDEDVPAAWVLKAGGRS